MESNDACVLQYWEVYMREDVCFLDFISWEMEFGG